MDAAKIERYRVEESVAAVTRDSGHQRRWVGTTRDVSMGGLFFYADFSPPLGSDIQLMFMLPAQATHHHSVPVLARGRVVRVEPDHAGTEVGIAVKVDEYMPLTSDEVVL